MSPSLNEEERLARYGWVVAVNPLGQTIAAPVLGILYAKTGSARLVGIITSVAYILGNILYSILTVFPEDYRYPLLLVSRFIVGACAGLLKDQKRNLVYDRTGLLEVRPNQEQFWPKLQHY